MILLAFASYDEARSRAQAEATLPAQQVQTAQFLPAGVRTELTGELVCYGRSVAGVEWDAVDADPLTDAINPWGAEMFHTIMAVTPITPIEQSAYDRWIDQTGERQQARDDRLHGRTASSRCRCGSCCSSCAA